MSATKILARKNRDLFENESFSNDYGDNASSAVRNAVSRKFLIESTVYLILFDIAFRL